MRKLISIIASAALALTSIVVAQTVAAPTASAASFSCVMSYSGANLQVTAWNKTCDNVQAMMTYRSPTGRPETAKGAKTKGTSRTGQVFHPCTITGKYATQWLRGFSARITIK